MAGIVKRGQLADHSYGFADLAKLSTGGYEKLTTAVLKELGGQVMETGEGTPGDLVEAFIETAKVYAQAYAPDQAAKVSERFHQLGEKRVESKSFQTAFDLLTFCEAMGLDPKAGARIVKDDINFTQARIYYDWKGSLVEAYHGTVFSRFEKRRTFVIYLPEKTIVPRSTLKLTISGKEFR